MMTRLIAILKKWFQKPTTISWADMNKSLEAGPRRFPNTGRLGERANLASWKEADRSLRVGLRNLPPGKSLAELKRG